MIEHMEPDREKQAATVARRPGTRARIQAAAMDLFMTRGVEKTSLREIAEELGITKAALYYHFRSRDELLRSLVDPFLEEVEALLNDTEARGDRRPREFLEFYFDLYARHQRMLQLLVRDLSAFAHLGLEERLLGWQLRLRHLVVGPEASPADRVRAVFALGGLADVAALITDVSTEDSRQVAIDAASAALGLTTGT